MIKDVLIVGCSFIEHMRNMHHQQFDQFGSAAASNASIAGRVMYQLSRQEYKKVVILWTGINRISIPIDIELHKLYRLHDNPWRFFDNQDPIVWYHSGGIQLDWITNLSKFINDYFKTQYKTISPRYLTDQTLLNIIGVQSYLENKKIDYEMNFVYDIHKDYTNTKFGYSLGNIDTSSPLYNLVNWNKINQHHTPYEWGKQHGYLDEDNWHVTSEGMVKWFRSNLGIDLPS